MTEERLLEIMTKTMEDYGMPKFGNMIPAMDVLRIVKDSKLGRPELE